MTKKDYIKIANVIKNSETVEDVVKGLCWILLQDNPHFDEIKFREACKRSYD